MMLLLGCLEGWCLFMLAVMCLVMKIHHSLMLTGCFTGCFSKNLPKGEIVVPMVV